MQTDSMHRSNTAMKLKAIFSALLFCAIPAWSGVPGGAAGGVMVLHAVNDLRAVRKGDRVTLTWNQPAHLQNLENGAPGLEFTRTRICRVVASAPAVSWPLSPVGCAQAVGEVDATKSRSAKAAGKNAKATEKSNGTLQFTDTLNDQLQSADPPQFATYRLDLRDSRGQNEGISNLAWVSLAPIAAVKGLHFQLDVRGVFLIWEQEVEMRPASVEYDFRLYRQEKDPHMGKSAAKRIAIPFLRSVVHTREGERLSAVDTNIEWEKTYVYWVRPVTRVYSPDHKLVAEIEGEDSEPIEVFAHDVFPPATPAGFLAMASEIPGKKFVDMVWAPNAENDVAEYRIYRKEEGGELTRIGTAPATMLSYHDTNVVAGHKYFYAISAIDLRGNESSKTPETTEVTP